MGFWSGLKSVAKEVAGDVSRKIEEKNVRVKELVERYEFHTDDELFKEIRDEMKGKIIPTDKAMAAQTMLKKRGFTDEDIKMVHELDYETRKYESRK